MGRASVAPVSLSFLLDVKRERYGLRKVALFLVQTEHLTYLIDILEVQRRINTSMQGDDPTIIVVNAFTLLCR